MFERIKDKKIILAMVSIVIIGAFLRFYNLGSVPAGFFCDEAGQSYYAYIISKSGIDPKGNFLPFYVDVFGPIGPVAIYDQIPAIKIFGLNEFGSRFTAALLGTLTVVVVFFLAYALFEKNVRAGIMASFLTATLPWHIHFSRFGTENIRLPFYFSLFLLFFILGVEKEKKVFLFISLISMFTAFYSYTAANLFIPPFFIGIVILYRKFFIKFKKFSLVFFLTALIFSIPFLTEMKENNKHSRFSEVSVFKNKTNKEAFIAMKDTYLQSFSPSFLFLKGDAGIPHHFITRFSVRGVGELYPITAPFFLIGMYYLLRNIRKKEYSILIIWLTLYPIGSVVAGADGGGPFATRSIIGVLVFPLITALGFISLLLWIKKETTRKLFTAVTILALLLSLVQYTRLYFMEYPKYSLDFWGWQYGARDIVQYFVDKHSIYDELIMAPEFNAPEVFLKFYGDGKCYKCKIGLPEDSLKPNKKQLFAVIPSYLKKNNFKFKTIRYIYYPNGKVAFQIGTIVK